MQKLLQKLEEKSLLMTHVVIGYPSIEETEKLVLEMANSGVDIIELQIPFSDPVADGPVIMQANDIAVKNGTSTKDCLKLMKNLSSKIDIPLLFMGYYNSIFNYGTEKFLKEAKACGCEGLIIPDMPIDEEEHENFFQNCEKYKLAPIIVIAPNTEDDRLKKLAKFAKGFVYLMARKGTTGTKTEFKKDFDKYIKRVNKYIKIPFGVGFGISEKEQVDFVHKDSKIAVIGSHIINIYNKAEKNKKLKEVSSFIKSLK